MTSDNIQDFPDIATFQVAPRRRESGWSFLYRLAEHNGYVGASQVLEYYEALFRRPLPAFLTVIHWISLAPRHIDAIIEWLEGASGIALLDETGAAPKRFCPGCIRENSPFIASWSGTLRVCEIHRCPLEAGCWDCKQPLSWMTGGWDACRCGAPILAPRKPSFRFGQQSTPSLQEWKVFERFEELDRQEEILQDAFKKLEQPHPLDSAFDASKISPGDWSWWTKGPPPEDLERPFKVIPHQLESGAWWFKRVYE